jgi:hypothetical protein
MTIDTKKLRKLAAELGFWPGPGRGVCCPYPQPRRCGRWGRALAQTDLVIPAVVRGRCPAERHSQCRQDRGQLRPLTGVRRHRSRVANRDGEQQASGAGQRRSKPELAAGMSETPTDHEGFEHNHALVGAEAKSSRKDCRTSRLRRRAASAGQLNAAQVPHFRQRSHTGTGINTLRVLFFR